MRVGLEGAGKENACLLRGLCVMSVIENKAKLKSDNDNELM